MFDSSDLLIALPKGRMSDETIDYFFAKKITSFNSIKLNKIKKDNRELYFHDREKKISFIKIRSQDIGIYVERGAVDLGIVGTDLIAEHNYSVHVLHEFPFGKCELSVAIPENHLNWKKYNKVSVATKYVNLTTKFFIKREIVFNIVELSGAIEIAPLMGLSEIIVDLVSTGKTLKANSLIKGDQILQSAANLIVNPVSNIYKRATLNNLLNKLLT